MARAHDIVTLSESVGRALANKYPRTANRIHAIRPGPSFIKNATKKKSGTTKSTYFYVGNHRPHKRIPFLLRAFQRARRNAADITLTLAGRPDPRFPEVLSMLEGGFGENVRFLNSAPDEQIANEMADASAVVFPSVGEGFGFPVLEAYSLGVPCIVSDAGSLPEVGGPGALCVQADDEGAWAQALTRFYRDRALQRSLREQIPQHFAQFSWDRFVSDMFDVMRNSSIGRA